MENVLRKFKKQERTQNHTTPLSVSKAFFSEFGYVYGSHNASYDTVRICRKKVHTTTVSIKGAAKSG